MALTEEQKRKIIAAIGRRDTGVICAGNNHVATAMLPCRKADFWLLPLLVSILSLLLLCACTSENQDVVVENEAVDGNLFSPNTRIDDKIFNINEFVTAEIIQNPPIINGQPVERWKLSYECRFANNDTLMYAFSFIPNTNVDVSSYGQLVILEDNKLIRKYEDFSFSPTYDDCFKSLTVEKQAFVLFHSHDNSAGKFFLRTLDTSGAIRDTIEISARNEFRFIYDNNHELLKISGYNICKPYIDCFSKSKNALDNKAFVENIKKELNVRSFFPFMGLGAHGEFQIFTIGADGKFYSQNDQLEFIKEAENALILAKDWGKERERTREDRINYILGFVGLLYKIDDRKKQAELYSLVTEYIGIDTNIDIFMKYWKLFVEN